MLARLIILFAPLLVFLLVFFLRCGSLYEQDNANMSLEPSVISETVLPYLLCLAKRYPESSVLAKLLDQWEQENTISVRESLSICAKLHLGN